LPKRATHLFTPARRRPTLAERIAIVSDIHSNLEALIAVMKDIEKTRCSKIYCLGDLIGYGPNPKECIDLARSNFEFVIKGNHDQAVGWKIPKVFKEMAADAAFWTRTRLKPKLSKGPSVQQRRWSYLRKMPRTQEHGLWLMAHGTPNSNLDYVYEEHEAEPVFRDAMAHSRVCFLGHTHLPGIFLQDGDKQVYHLEGEEGIRYKLQAERSIINVGSVGQPRDGDPRACWVLAHLDGSFSFRRVEYEVEKTAEKIYKTGLDPYLGERLFDGD
jgi:diadenosine tetraphosphatase ApaH/serine/threonine PP2A family protein phosphatase